jgi:LPPG:FO 2-phospho-L-lactate transferase
MQLTVLAGGTGSIKFVRAFDDNINVICNVGDNIWLHGLYICPDIDTILYGLADILDKERGWGIKNDTFNFINQLRTLGVETWFNIGDKDLATHIIRTKMLKEGNTLYSIIRYLSKALNVKSNIIPSTEDELQTYILTDKGLMHLQEFWVKYKGELEVKDIIYKGIEKAKGHPFAIKAIKESSTIILAPGNPISSINPIISIKDIREVLKSVKDRCLAISPIIGNSPISGPAGKYMKALGYDISLYSIARLYSDVISILIIDNSDKDKARDIELKFGIKVYSTDIIIKDRSDEQRIADFIKRAIR